LKEVVTARVAEAKSDQLEQLKVMLIKQYAEKIDKLQEDLKEKEFEVNVHKSDNRLLCEKLDQLEEQLQPKENETQDLDETY